MSELFVQKIWMTHTHNLENSGEIPMHQITCDYGNTCDILNQYAHDKLFETIIVFNFEFFFHS